MWDPKSTKYRQWSQTMVNCGTVIRPQGIYSHLPIWSINTESPMTNTKMMLSMFTPIEGSSSSGEINKGNMPSRPHILQQNQLLSPKWKKICWDSQADKYIGPS